MKLRFIERLELRTFMPSRTEAAERLLKMRERRVRHPLVRRPSLISRVWIAQDLAS